MKLVDHKRWIQIHPPLEGLAAKMESRVSSPLFNMRMNCGRQPRCDLATMESPAWLLEVHSFLNELSHHNHLLRSNTCVARRQALVGLQKVEKSAGSELSTGHRMGGTTQRRDRQTVLIGTRTHTPPDSISSRLRLCVSHVTGRRRRVSCSDPRRA